MNLRDWSVVCTLGVESASFFLPAKVALLVEPAVTCAVESGSM